MIDLTLMVLVDPATVPEEMIPDFCDRVRQGGATVIQLRGKNTTTRDLVHYGRKLRIETGQRRLGFIVNDRLDVALAVEADGIHVGQSDMRVRDVRKWAPQRVVGLSIRIEEDIPIERDRPDYFGIGPVFATASKIDAGEAIGVEGLARLTRKVRSMALSVAIGGITVENASAVWSAAVDGIAVISAVHGAVHPEVACRQLVEARTHAF